MRVTLRQPWITAGFATLYMAALAGAVLVSRAPTPLQTFLAIALAVSGVATLRFPVHVAAHIKLYLTAPPLLIAAVVLPPVVATGTTLLIGVAGNILIRERTGLTPSDIANEGLRWASAATVASILFHALPQSWQPAPLIVAAIMMYLLDVVSLAVIIATLVPRSLGSIFSDAFDNWRFEAAMYLIGALGALDAGYQPWALALLVIPCVLIYKAVQSTYELQGSTRRLVEGLADTVDARDAHTGSHSKRVAEYARILVMALKANGRLGPIEADLIVTAARVHDIGKIEIPDAILHKVSNLSPAEEEVMASHVERGADILKCYPNFRRGVPIVRHHHESWDGTGYPYHLSKHDIPLGSRVVAIADAYASLTSELPYCPALSPDRAAAALRNGRGIQWDPELVDSFLTAVGVSVQRHLHLVQDAAQVSSVETA